MTLYSQIAHLPIIFKCERGASLRLEGSLLSSSLSFRNIIVASGRGVSRTIADRVVTGLLGCNVENVIVSANSEAEVARLHDVAERRAADLVIGVGGGRVNDVCKRLSRLHHLNYLYIPTVVSNDGLMSPISVLKDEEGLTQSLPGAMPMGILIDLDIVMSAPEKYLRAAAGDLLSNLSAINDWKFAAAHFGHRMNDVALHMAEQAAISGLQSNSHDLGNERFVAQVVGGQVFSGIAMALAGSSRPCSGSEHLISHAIDYLGRDLLALHGEQVGSISLFTLWLQGELRQAHLDYAHNLGLNPYFPNLVGIQESDTMEIFQASRKVRPGRRTVLDRYEDEQLCSKLIEFRRSIA